jgi:hypothetical protein
MFDASNRQACRVRPSTTSTPLHALTTLNDPTWVEAARVLARRSMERRAAPDDRLAYAFRLVLSRRPTDNDLKALRRAYDRQAAIFAADPGAARAMLGVGASPRDASLDAVEHAALAATCLAILNLDEALTRE